MSHKNQGRKWIRDEKRVAIYARDGFKCAYCGRKGHLSLDHLKPRSQGGSNAATNLVTSCVTCNVEKRDFSLNDFVGDEAAAEIRKVARRKIYVAKAKPYTYLLKKPERK